MVERRWEIGKDEKRERDKVGERKYRKKKGKKGVGKGRIVKGRRKIKKRRGIRKE